MAVYLCTVIRTDVIQNGGREVPIAIPARQVPIPERFDHQERCLQLGRENPSYAFFLETGTGKTRIAIDIIEDVLKRDHTTKALVVCPLSIIEHAWMEDIDKFAPQLKAVSLWAPTKAKRMYNMQTNAYSGNIFIINFEGFRLMYEEIQKILNPRILIVDESSKMKSMKSIITKKIIAFGQNLDYRYILSGTPAPNSEEEYFAQMRLVDPTIFGINFWGFRNKWFRKTGFGGYTVVMIDHLREEFMEKMSTKAIFIAKEDCLDLPEKVFVEHEVQMTKPQEKIYRDMMKHLIAEVKGQDGYIDRIAVRTMLAKIMKLRQITSGFVIDSSKKVRHVSDAKLNELMSLLEIIGDKQVAIWCQFHGEMIRIREVLGDKVGVLSGLAKNQAERDETIRRWKAGDLQYVICHPRSVGHGHTWTHCTHSISYSLGDSWENYKQLQDRFHRHGTTSAVTYYALLARGTIDWKIYRALDKKRSMSEAMLEMLKEEM